MDLIEKIGNEVPQANMSNVNIAGIFWKRVLESKRKYFQGPAMELQWFINC